MKFYGQLYSGANEKTDEWLVRRFFAAKRNGFFVECGALNGISISNCLVLERELGWSGINIEPSKSFDELIVNRPNCLNLRLALSNKDGALLNFFEDETNLACSTSSSDIADALSDPNNSHHIIETKVPTITFRTLVERVGIKRIDLFSLDVEGMELEVLEGMEHSRILPRHIFIETMHHDRNTLHKKLDDLGYYLIENFHIDAMYGLR